MVRKKYREWMYRWEHALTSRDTNRIVRPFEWGLDWAERWPVAHSAPKDHSEAEIERYWFDLNERIVEHSEEFYSYRRPTNFCLEQRPVRVHQTGSNPDPKLDRKHANRIGTFLRFTSPVETPYPENNLMNARWFPAERSKKAMIVIPQWNSDAISHNALCKIWNMLGISGLRISMPYHDARMPAELKRADYAVSANMGRTIDAARQGVIDIRCCVDWLEEQGYTDIGIMGTSLGSCYAFIASAHDERLKINVFNHASTYFGDVVWTGQSTRHIRAAVEEVMDQDGMRKALLGVSPMVYFQKFARWPKRCLMLYAKYDLTFLPEFSEQIAAEFKRWGLNAMIKCMPCGHYTIGESPYKYMLGWNISRFVAQAFAN
jgi:hypothetical protein